MTLTCEEGKTPFQVSMVRNQWTMRHFPNKQIMNQSLLLYSCHLLGLNRTPQDTNPLIGIVTRCHGNA